MSKLLNIIVLLFIMGLCNAQEEDVLACFSNYKRAILNDQGEEALKYIDANTLTYYEGILEKTKTADSIMVDKLPLMDKMMVLIVRQRHLNLMNLYPSWIFRKYSKCYV